MGLILNGGCRWSWPSLIASCPAVLKPDIHVRVDADSARYDQNAYTRQRWSSRAAGKREEDRSCWEVVSTTVVNGNRKERGCLDTAMGQEHHSPNLFFWYRITMKIIFSFHVFHILINKTTVIIRQAVRKVLRKPADFGPFSLNQRQSLS